MRYEGDVNAMVDRTPRSYALVNAEAHVVTYYHANVRVCTPYPNDSGTEQVEYLRCEHDHTSLEAAEACAARIARRLVGRTDFSPEGRNAR